MNSETCPLQPPPPRAPRTCALGLPLLPAMLFMLLLQFPGWVQAAVLIPSASTWRWLPGIAEASSPGDAWRARGFDDSAFTTAPAPFWYGDVLPGGTEITGMRNVYSCLFLRIPFTLTNLSQVGGLRLGALVDDGFVAWINGVEVLRVNMPGDPLTEVNITTLALNALEPVPFKVYDLPAPPSYLVAGTNVLAVQVFQSSIGSSDIGFDASLETVVAETVPPTLAGTTPPAGATAGSLSQITVTFSEPVQGVTAGHLLVAGIGAVSMTAVNPTTYTFSFQQPPYGQVPITWNPGHNITDLALPPNRFDASGPGATWFYTLVDQTPPQVAALTPAAGSTIRSFSSLTVLFDEPVLGVGAADLLVNGRAADSVIPSGPSQYFFSFPEPKPGLVTLAWAAGHGIKDRSPAANPFAGGNWSNRLDPNALESPPYISEVMSSNTRTLADETGKFSDWIEIYNPAEVPLNLEGWYLTDSAKDLTKWRFPATNLAAGKFLVVFASGDSRRLPGAPLHTGFQLSASGEYLALVRPDGAGNVTEFRPSLPQQPPDVSYGFVQTPSGKGFTAGSTGVYFTLPTPGAANLGGTAVPGPVIESVSNLPNVPRDDQDLAVTAAVRPSFLPVAGVSLHYRVQFGPETVVPMLDDGLHADGAAGDGVYGAVIPSALSTEGQMIRWWVGAADTGSRTSRWPLFTSPTDAEEYLGTIVEPVGLTSRLPIFHLFVSPDQLPGIDTESGGRVAVFYDGEFYDNIYMELRGNTSAGLNKKSHRLEFNRGHAFRHAGPGGRSRRSSLLAEYLDPAYLRQHLSFWFLDQIGVPAPYHYPVRVQMNGQFYQLAFHNDVIGQEQVERMGYDPAGALYKAVGTLTPDFYSTGVFQKLEPDDDQTRTDYLALANGINETSTTTVRRRTVFDMLDVPQVINHLAGTRWCAENDDVWANMSLWRDTHGDGLWRNIPFDMNASWGQLYGGSSPLEATVDTSKSHPLYGGSSTGGTFNRLYDVIIALPETRAMLLRRMRTIMDQWVQPPGTPTAALILENHIKGMTNLIAPEAALDRARWGFSPWAAGKTFSAGVGDLLTQFVGPRRRHWYVTHSITNTSRPIGISPSGNAGIPLSQPWDASMAIVGVEFNPVSRRQSEEFVCLSNTMPYAVDLSGWKLGGGVEFTFMPGTVAPSNSLIYISPHIPSFRSRTAGPRGGQGLFVVGPYQGQLSSRGETLYLENALGQRVTTRSYAGSPSLAQQFLRVTEIMFHPAALAGSALDPEEFEFIELRNTSTSQALPLAGVQLTNGITFQFTGAPLASLSPGQRVLLVRNIAAFTSRYGAGLPVAGQYVGSLDNAGERIRILDADGEEILDFEYSDGWQPIADGLGFSLHAIDESAEPDAWGRRTQWAPGTLHGGTPGTAEPPAPDLPAVRINEALTRSDLPPPVDTIELHNPGSEPAAIGGWWLTDDLNTPAKFRIPAGRVIPPGGYTTFDELQFNTPPNGFALGSDGDEVWLLSADATGRLTGLLQGYRFGAANDGESFGRHVTSDSRELFVAQSARSLGSPNSGPRVGPVVIGEIHYHPPERPDGSDNTDDEYIELLNASSSLVRLFDIDFPTNTWRLRGAIDFDFPPGITLAAGEHILLVHFDPAQAAQSAAFRAARGVPPAVRLLGPCTGKLENSGSTVELRSPATPSPTGVPYVVADRVEYGDSAPWPGGADGYGLSLQRRTPLAFGDDPASWVAAAPTAGAPRRDGTAPVITSQPQSRNTAPGTLVTLSVGASGDVLRYQWRFNGTNLPGATGSNLVLNPMSPLQAGDYRVLVFNDAGSEESLKATLTMTPPTLILTQPRGATVTTGSPFTLTLSTRSPWGLRHQWRRNGVDLPGQTSPSLSVPSAQTADEGDYAVVVADPITTLTSAVARISVVTPPVFVLHPVSQPLLVGGPLILSAVIAEDATPPVGFRLMRGATPLPPEAAALFRPDSSTVFFRLEGTNVAPPWTNYSIMATNPASPGGTISETARIEYLPDADANGLPDPWEEFFLGGGAIPPGDDRDRDGASNQEEWVAGTNPADGGSVFGLTAVGTPSGVLLQFLAISNRTYTVQVADGLPAVSWRPLRHIPATATNQTVTASDVGGVQGRLYRIVTPFEP